MLSILLEGQSDHKSFPAVNTACYNMTGMLRYVYLCNSDMDIVGDLNAFLLDSCATPEDESHTWQHYQPKSSIVSIAETIELMSDTREGSIILPSGNCSSGQ